MLKYLFHAEYTDGTIFYQMPEDVSKQDSKRSAFYDVDHSRLRAFHLLGQEYCYTVNLVDGSFMVNGVSFRMHEEPLENFRLIFFRRHTHSFTGSSETHKIVYRLGWQATDAEGRNQQRVMEID